VTVVTKADGAGDEMPERGFMSIGEVLDLLKAEYPDVTISKIRFLESQGLIDPERTPSGYRKFHQPDIDRLRWILHQQRDNFLPLKVIKEKLADAGSGDAQLPLSNVPQPSEAPAADPSPATVAPSAPAPETVDPEAPTEPAPVTPGSRGPLVEDLSSASLSRKELVDASGLSETQLDELERFGLLSGRPVSGQVYYDGECLVVARLAASFAQHGVEARHLRMYKTSAEREAGFYEQVVQPLIRQRNPRARSQARANLAELARLGESLRGALLREALRGYTSGS
jgi:DNA-binding transcriptional MerR regulator